MPSLLDRLKNGDNDGAESVVFDDDFPDDLAKEIVPDPVPGKSRAGGRGPAHAGGAGGGSSSRRPVSAAVRKRLADELHAYATMVALAWSVRDDYCGPVLSDQSRAIAEALADIIARNPAMVRWVETSGMVGDWVKLSMAVMPVVTAFRQHHIVRSVPSDDEEGADAAVDYSRYAAHRPSA
jgi:hypothetical protein